MQLPPPRAPSPATSGESGFRRVPLGAAGLEAVLQRFYKLQCRHGDPEGPAEGCGGGRAERYVSEQAVTPRPEMQESRPPDVELSCSEMSPQPLIPGRDSGVLAVSPDLFP